MFKETNIFSRTRLGLAFVLALLIALPFATPANAGEVIPGNPDAYLGPDEVIDDDLFVSGRFVRIDGIVRGDLFVVGQEIEINGTVEGNVFTFGQSHTINGTVGGSVFAGGYSIKYGPDADINGSSYFGGFALLAAQGSQIARNLYMGGYQADLTGEVGRDVIASLSALKLDGNVGGDVLLQLNESRDSRGNRNDFTFYIPGNVEILPEGIDQGEDSSIGGELDYSVNRIRFDVPVFDGSFNPDFSADIVGAYFANFVRTRVGEFFSLLILGALFFYLWPKRSGETVDELTARPFANMGWGLLVALLFPLVLVIGIGIVIMLALIGGVVTLGELAGTILSIGGLAVAAFWILGGLLFWMISKTIFAYYVGRALIERIRPETLDSRWAAVLVLALGLFLYEILRAVPLFGAIAAIFVILAGVGALYQVARKALQERRSA